MFSFQIADDVCVVCPPPPDISLTITAPIFPTATNTVPISPLPTTMPPSFASSPLTTTPGLANQVDTIDPPSPSVPPAISASPPAPRAPSRTHPMVTRAQTDSLKAKRFASYSTSVPASSNSTCYTQAMKHPKWHTAITAEYNALIKNGTWRLVPPYKASNTVGCKWVFKMKTNADGSVECHKARLVAKGYHQRPDIDFDDTFSLIVKPTTVHLLLSLAVC